MSGRGEDGGERLLRLIRERREQLAEKLTTGSASAENIRGGYLSLAGEIMGLTWCEQTLIEMLQGPPPSPGKRYDPSA